MSASRIPTFAPSAANASARFTKAPGRAGLPHFAQTRRPHTFDKRDNNDVALLLRVLAVYGL